MYAVRFHLDKTFDDSTPSRREGVSLQEERNQLCFAVEVLQEAALVCKLDSSVFTRAAILLQRFFCRKSMRKYDVKSMIAPALALAAKLEDCMPEGAGRNYSQLMRIILTVVDHLLQLKEGKSFSETECSLEYLSQEYNRKLRKVLDGEREMLAALGFILNVEHPQRFLITFTKLLDLDKAITQCAWNYLLDSLRLNLHVLYRGNAIATGCIYLSFCRLRRSMPKTQPPWYVLLDVTTEELFEIITELLRLYTGEVTSKYSELASPGKEPKKDEGGVVEITTPQNLSVVVDQPLLPTVTPIEKVDTSMAEDNYKPNEVKVTEQLTQGYRNNEAERKENQSVSEIHSGNVVDSTTRNDRIDLPSQKKSKRRSPVKERRSSRERYKEKDRHRGSDKKESHKYAREKSPSKFSKSQGEDFTYKRSRDDYYYEKSYDSNITHKHKKYK